MRKKTEKRSITARYFFDKSHVMGRGLLPERLNTASNSHFAACTKLAGCLAMFGMMLSPQLVSADNNTKLQRLTPAMATTSNWDKPSVIKSMGGGSVVKNDTIPFDSLETHNRWSSADEANQSRTSFKHSWELVCEELSTLQLNLSYDLLNSSTQVTLKLNDVNVFTKNGAARDSFPASMQLSPGRYVLTATLSKSYGDTSSFLSVSDISVDNIIKLASKLTDDLSDKAGLHDELSEMLEKAREDESNDSVKAELRKTYNAVVAALDYYTRIQANIEKAHEILETAEDAKLSKALDDANAFDTTTARSHDYKMVSDALSASIVIYNSANIPQSEWNFGTKYTSSTNVGYFKIKTDTTNKLVRIVGLAYNNVDVDTLDIPPVFIIDNEEYGVVSVNFNEESTTQEIIRAINLPETVRGISNYGLSKFSNVREIIIPENVETIGANAFSSDNNLSCIRMLPVAPPTLEALGVTKIKAIVPHDSFHAYRLSFESRNNTITVLGGEEGVSVSTGRISGGELGRIVVEDAGYLQEVNRLVIDGGTFSTADWTTLKSMSNLVELDISGVSVDAIPNNAFSDMYSLEKIILPRQLKSLGKYAFQNTSLGEIEMPENVTTIGEGLFSGCSKLTSARLSEKITAIPNLCFSECYLLSDVNINDSLTSIGSAAFYNCLSLKRINIPQSITQIENRTFYQCVSLEQIEIPQSVIQIGQEAFYNCYGLRDVTFNEGLAIIGSNAFAACSSLQSIVLPSSLENCSGHPFTGCTDLKRIESRAMLPPATNGSCPISVTDGVVLYVPSWGLSEYKLASGWKTIPTILETDFRPQNIKVFKDYYFISRDEPTSEYRPNVSMLWSQSEITDEQGHNVYERGNLVVSERSKLFVNNLSLVLSPFAKCYADKSINQGYNYDYYKTYINNTSLVVNGEMSAENIVLQLCNLCNYWQFISFPFDVRVGDIVPADESTSWVIRSHSGANRAAGKNNEVWQNLTADDVLEAGKGYIMHCNGGEYINAWFYVTSHADGENKQLIFDANNRTMQLEEYASEFEHNRNWNLIGNPYPSFYDTRFLDFDAPFMVWNSYTGNYVAYSPVDDAYILSPGEAFFIQRPDDTESITFRQEGRQIDRYARTIETGESRTMANGGEVQASLKLRANNTERKVYNITLANGDKTDRTRVVINEQASMGYEMSRDASKFDSADPTASQIYTHNGNTHYSINERPLASGEVALGVRCGSDGDFTIALDEHTYGTVVLVDKEANVVTEISSAKGYSFTAKAGDYNSRFVVRFAQDATAIDNVETTENDAEEAETYTLQGVKVGNADTHRGIYIQNGKKTIKK